MMMRWSTKYMTGKGRRLTSGPMGKNQLNSTQLENVKTLAHGVAANAALECVYCKRLILHINSGSCGCLSTKPHFYKPSSSSLTPYKPTPPTVSPCLPGTFLLPFNM